MNEEGNIILTTNFFNALNTELLQACRDSTDIVYGRQKQVSNSIEERMKHDTVSSGLKLADKDKNNLVNETLFVKEPVIHVYKTINNLRIKNINKIVNSIRGKLSS